MRYWNSNDSKDRKPRVFISKRVGVGNVNGRLSGYLRFWYLKGQDADFLFEKQPSPNVQNKILIFI